MLLILVSGFPDKVLILYAAEISSAVNHLHQNGIIHRDLKPENILVDDEGHLLLTDFNCSLSLKDKIPESRAGTLDYLAPEMFLDEPYKYSVDWWSFGIVPFKENRSEQTIESIKSKPLTFPTKHKVSGKFVYPSTHRDTFIQGLLERDIELRYGSSQNGLGFSVDIQPHPWLENINWKLLEERKIVPPFIPANVQNPAISPSECFDPKSKLKKLEKENKSNLSRIGSMTSILSNMFSKKSKNTLDSIQKSDANLIASAEPTDPSSREQIELEQLLEHFHPFSHEADNQLIVVMPPTRKYRKATNESSGSSQAAAKPLSMKQIKVDTKTSGRYSLTNSKGVASTPALNSPRSTYDLSNRSTLSETGTTPALQINTKARPTSSILLFALMFSVIYQFVCVAAQAVSGGIVEA
ncbi:hypothetical protein HDV02_000104 [Globomyces sp. JEL0801]|nr:hypothetical protein HDV02_000104 [Globomyces sp. JEL0801]